MREIDKTCDSNRSQGSWHMSRKFQVSRVPCIKRDISLKIIKNMWVLKTYRIRLVVYYICGWYGKTYNVNLFPLNFISFSKNPNYHHSPNLQNSYWDMITSCVKGIWHSVASSPQPSVFLLKSPGCKTHSLLIPYQRGWHQASSWRRSPQDMNHFTRWDRAILCYPMNISFYIKKYRLQELQKPFVLFRFFACSSPEKM